MNHMEYVKGRKSEIVEIAHEMLKQKIQLIEGVRKICAIRTELDEPDDPVFLTLRAMESDTDAFPLGKARDALSSDYLRKADIELRQYLTTVEADILHACEQIVARFSL